MKALNRLVLTLSCAALATTVSAHEAHVHGEGRMDLTLDKDALQIALEMPLDVLLGFEHSPRTAAQKSAFAAALQKMRAPDQLFGLPAAAQCKLQEAEVPDPFVKKEANADKGGEEHTDLDADYSFQCANAAALRGIEVKLFAALPRLHKLSVQLAVPGSQRAATLTPKNSSLRW